MFRQQNVYTMIAGFGVRVKDEREQNRNHIVEVDLELPMDYSLAEEILPAMARDLFIKVGGDMKPRPEMQQCVFAFTTAKQIMEVRVHPELKAEARIEGVELRKIRAVKSEGGAWLLKFTAYWTLGLPSEVVLVIQRLKLGVYLTMQEQAPTLDLGTGPVDAEVVAAQGAEAAGGDLPAGRKKRGRKNPEAEKVTQIEEGRKLKALPEPEAGATGPQEWDPNDPPGTVYGDADPTDLDAAADPGGEAVGMEATPSEAQDEAAEPVQE